VLEPFVHNMLYASLAYYFVFFLTRIHFLFIEQTLDHDTYKFFGDQMLFGLVADIKSVIDGKSPDVLAMGSFKSMSMLVSAIALGALVALSIFVPVLVLRQAAQRSSDRNRIFLNTADPRACAPSRPSLEQQRSKLDAMQIWPLQYPTEVLLIVLSVTAAFCFFFYHLTFILTGVLMVSGYKLVHGLLRKTASDQKGITERP
jgi:hypothetical protein